MMTADPNGHTLARMKYPPSKNLGTIEKDGRTYTLHFFGENEGAAVVTIPNGQPVPGGGMVETREVHREGAKDADDARAKLTARLELGGLK